MAVIKVPFTMRFEPEIHAKLKKIAKKDVRSMANMIDYLVIREIERYEAVNGVIELTEEDLSLE